MEKTIKAIDWPNANNGIPQLLIGARDRAALSKPVGSMVKVTRKSGRSTATTICIINPIFREHIGHAMLNAKAAEVLTIGSRATKIGDKVTLDPRVTETEAEEFRGTYQADPRQYIMAALAQGMARAQAQAQAEQED